MIQHCFRNFACSETVIFLPSIHEKRVRISNELSSNHQWILSIVQPEQFEEQNEVFERTLTMMTWWHAWKEKRKARPCGIKDTKLSKHARTSKGHWVEDYKTASFFFKITFHLFLLFYKYKNCFLPRRTPRLRYISSPFSFIKVQALDLTSGIQLSWSFWFGNPCSCQIKISTVLHET